MESMKFSVLLSVYARETTSFLNEALNSIEKQTLIPDEIILVKDGPLNIALDEVISYHIENSNIPYNIISLKENVGLGEALNEGMKHCSYDWIARMDSDDIAISDRFETQISYLERYQEIDVLGSWISEFENNPNIPTGERKPPNDHHLIEAYAKYRNPINHMTVMFRKNAVTTVGGYLPMRGFEDYWLWIRMLKEGYVFANIEEVLVYARTGEGMLQRRRGLRYMKDEINFEKNGWVLGFFSFYEMSRNIMIRVFVRLLPSSILKKVYNALRK